MDRLFEADSRAYVLLHGRWRATWLDPLMVVATKAGTKGMIWLGLAAVVFITQGSRGRWVAFLSVAALLLAEGVINVALKPAVRRERPFQNRVLGRRGRLLVSRPGPNSWPSAHAGSSVAAAVVLSYAYPAWSPALLLLALLISYSRVYVGVHYPLDVLAGMAVGLLAAIVTLLIGVHIRPI